MRCRYCGKIVQENVKPLYEGHCSWTCLSRHRKEEEEKRREKENERYLKKRKALEQKLKEKEAAAKTAVKKETVQKHPKKRKERAHASILQLNASGELIRRFESAKEAAEKMGSAKANIYYACAHGTRYRGFLWAYAKD